VVKMNEKTISQPSPLDTINNLTAAINRGDIETMLKLSRRTRFWWFRP